MPIKDVLKKLCLPVIGNPRERRPFAKIFRFSFPHRVVSVHSLSLQIVHLRIRLADRAE